MTTPTNESAVNRPLIIRGEKVGLGPMQREDIPVMAAWFNDPAYSTNLGRPGSFQTIESETEWFNKNASFRETSIQFAIVELATGAHIGGCGLFEIDLLKRCATLGIGIGDASKRGKGYGGEAVRLLCEYGMHFRSLYHIRLAVASFNTPGIRAYERVGFRVCGKYTGRWVVGGERYDEVLMEITRDRMDLSQVRKLTPLLPPRQA